MAINTLKTQHSLTREQKEAVGLLSIGTFLEYFDLMLYVHMAVLLNELFFPKTDPFTASLLYAFSFCVIFIFRPIGALIFGYIGDHIGRKSVVIMTTLIMALSCIVMAILPTYAQIGIAASWIMIVCRILQGMSSIGEIIGAELYLAETITPSLRCSSVALLGTFSVLGATAALGVSSLVFLMKLEWRYAFAIGALIALIGGVARTSLKETTDFSDAKRRINESFNKNQIEKSSLINDPFFNEPVNKKTVLALFMMDCSWPVCFYIGYIYCSDILKNTFGYTGEQVIKHNFFVSLSELLIFILLTYLASKFNPLKILKTLMIIFMFFCTYCIYSLENLTSIFQLFFIQSVIVAYGPIIMVAAPILFSHFPIFKRFTYVGTIHAISRAAIYTGTSFGLIYLTNIMNNHYGIFTLLIISSSCFAFGLFHFEKLEEEKNA
jgi:MFS transporter, MHS family, proline/betaine transporter